MTVLSQRNRFFRGDTADVLEPGREPYTVPLDRIFDEEGNPIEAAPHATMRVLLDTDTPIAPGPFCGKNGKAVFCPLFFYSAAALQLCCFFEEVSL